MTEVTKFILVECINKLLLNNNIKKYLEKHTIGIHNSCIQCISLNKLYTSTYILLFSGEYSCKNCNRKYEPYSTHEKLRTIFVKMYESKKFIFNKKCLWIQYYCVITLIVYHYNISPKSIECLKILTKEILPNYPIELIGIE